MVVYVYDTNTIMTKLLKNMMGPEISNAYKNMFAYLTLWVLKPTIHWLDNNSLVLLKTLNQSNEVDIQLVTLEVHRCNIY